MSPTPEKWFIEFLIWCHNGWCRRYKPKDRRADERYDAWAVSTMLRDIYRLWSEFRQGIRLGEGIENLKLIDQKVIELRNVLTTLHACYQPRHGEAQIPLYLRHALDNVADMEERIARMKAVIAAR